MIKRLEIIHLRLTGSQPPGLVALIRDSINNMDGFVKIRIYNQPSIATDLGVHIHLNTHHNDPSYTELGIRLASALREYGMVEHTIWLEEEL